MKEKLEARIAQLGSEVEQLVAAINARKGAIAELERLIGELDAAEE